MNDYCRPRHTEQESRTISQANNAACQVLRNVRRSLRHDGHLFAPRLSHAPAAAFGLPEGVSQYLPLLLLLLFLLLAASASAAAAASATTAVMIVFVVVFLIVVLVVCSKSGLNLGISTCFPPATPL